MLPTGKSRGELLIDGVTRLTPGAYYNYNNEGHFMIKSVENPSHREISSIGEGRALFGLILRESAIILLANFNCREWTAAHYNWWINPPVHRPDPVGDLVRLHEGLMLHVLLADASTGVIEVSQDFPLPSRFGRILLKRVAWQASAVFDPYRHLEVFNQTLTCYPALGELLAEAACVYSCGVNLPDCQRGRTVCSVIY